MKGKAMKKVLVTGATGRKTLHERGYETRSFAYDAPQEAALREKLRELGTEIVLGDLATGAGIREAVEGVDAVVHCAALMQEDRAPRQVFFDINTRGAFALLEALRDRKEPVQRAVMLTTGSVYDVLSAQPPYREDDELRPLSLYGTCKVLNEELYRLYHWHSGIPTITLRPNFILAGEEPLKVWEPGGLVGVMKANCSDPRTVLYSPRSEPWAALEEAIRQNPDAFVVPYGPEGKSWRWHVTDVRDVCSACICALTTENEEALGKSFNIASAKPQAFSEVVPYVARVLGRPYVQVRLPVLWDVEFDISRARSVLGYDPQYDYRRMIDDALAFRRGEDTGVIPPGIPH